MKYYFLLSSTILLNCNLASASFNNLGDTLGTHTHLPQIELSSHPFNPTGAFKLASICFLGNDECNDKFSGFNNAGQEVNTGAASCKNRGYNYTIDNCTNGKVLVDRCKYNGSYYKSCICPASWKICSVPEYGVGTPCSDNGTAKYEACQRDDKKACNSENKYNVCSGSQKLHNTNKCQWNNSYATCCTPKSCPNNSSLTCTGAAVGDDGCGYTCKQCCTENCPSGTSTTNPGGCGGSTSNGCGTKICYYPYKECCSTQKQRYDYCLPGGGHDYSIARYKYCDGSYSETWRDYECQQETCSCYKYWYDTNG